MAATIKSFPDKGNFHGGNITEVNTANLEEIASATSTSVKVDLGSDAGDDFLVDTDKLVVEGDTGNVGIGKADPDRKLEILDDTNPQLRLTNVDNTEYVEIQSKATGDAAIEMTDSNMWLRGNDTHCYLIIQNTITGKSAGEWVDSTGKGLTLSTAGSNAGINMAGTGAETLKIGCNTLWGIEIDATANITAVNNLVANGNVTLGDASDDTHTLNGTLQFAAEVAAPSAPGSGDGGIFYVKSDGIPYFISDSTAETSLVGGGGGGLTVTPVATGDSPVTGAVDTVYIVNTSGGNVEIDLPAASGNSGKTIDVLHKTTGYDCIIDPNSSETINGSSTSITLAGVAYQNVTLICDGTEWYIR